MFQFGGLGVLFGGAKPTKAPRGGGTLTQMVPTNSVVAVDVQLFDSQWELIQICAKTRRTFFDIIQTFDRSVFSRRPWFHAVMSLQFTHALGRRKGVRGSLGSPLDFEIFSEKGCFRISEWEKKFHHFGPTLEKFLKNPLLTPLGKNPSDAHAHVRSFCCRGRL